MNQRKFISRREFTVHSALAMLSGVTITILGCGDNSGGSSSPTPPPPPGGASGAIGANHGHTAIITAAELMAGNMLALNIRGTADHPHTVELTAAEVQQISGGARVSKVSTTELEHSHSVTFN
ncbi:MAG TPA: hypothetical protein VEK15_05505 [Vicinamibacteria bacterium]|nr:hypothetical protein [Vicinamibacteria bacterium]